MPKCEACKGKGYLLAMSSGSKVYRDGDTHIERCDACEMYAGDSRAEKAFIKALLDGEESIMSRPVTLYGEV
jgi:hypothetical protein